MHLEDDSIHVPPFSHGLFLSMQRKPSHRCINNKNAKIIHGVFPSISVETFPTPQDGL